MPSTTGERFERAVSIMERLRNPGGCPWDREQTFDSIKPHTVEETYEVLEAIDNRDWEQLPGELGDLLLQILFYSQMAKEEGTFTIDDVLDRLSEKLIGRHPHVFGSVKANTSSEVLYNWEAIKAEERKSRLTSKPATPQKGIPPRNAILADIPSAFPGLLEASKLSSRAAAAGFDWRNIEGLLEKLAEETEELRENLNEFPSPGPQPTARGIAGAGRQEISEDLKCRLEDEVGDLFFVLVNVARFLSVDPESALKKTNRKFRARFRSMENQLEAMAKKPEEVSIEEWESLWQRAKQQEKSAR
jgi:MazG family protein